MGDGNVVDFLETSLTHRVEGERLIATVLNRFLNALPEEIDQVIQQALISLRDSCQAESAFIRLLSADGRFFLQSASYVASLFDGNVELLPEVALDEIPWVASHFRQRKVLEIPSVDSLPVDASIEKGILRRLGIRAAVGVPIFVGGSLFLWIGMDQYTRERSWESETINLTRIIGQAIATTLKRKWGEESLRESESQYRATIEGLEDPLLVVDRDLRILLTNSAFLRVLQEWEGETEAVGRDVGQVLSFTGESDRLEYQQVLESGQLLESLTHLHRGPKEAIFLRKHFPIRDGNEITRVITLFEDVTTRTLAERTLHESEERARAILESSPDGIILFEPSGKIILANQEAAHMHGFQAPHLMLGLPLYDLMAPEEIQGILKLQQQVEKKGSSGRMEVILRRQDGTIFPGEIALSAIRDALGPPRAFFGIARDISEQKRAEEQLQLISRRVLSSQEAENRRISRELHDQIGQALSAVKINVQNIPAAALPEEQRGILEETVQAIDQAINQVRRLSLELRPVALDDLGLVAALQGTLDRMARRSGITISFAVEPPDLKLPQDLETVCFRVVQEAVVNVIRHAQAQHVWVELHREGKTVSFLVRDDGRGFDASRVKQDLPHEQNLGLIGMQERVLLARGQLEIVSRLGQGTTVQATFPLQEILSQRRRKR